MTRKAVFVLFVAVVSLGGGVAWATHSNPDVVHLCTHPKGMVRVVADTADCGAPGVVLDVASSTAVAALQTRTSALEADTAAMATRVSALEAALGAVSDSAGNWTFPGNVTVAGSLAVDGAMAAGGDAALGKSLSVGGELAVGESIAAGGNVTTNGDFIDNSTG
jgi:hypothetical protein